MRMLPLALPDLPCSGTVKQMKSPKMAGEERNGYQNEKQKIEHCKRLNLISCVV